MGKDVSAVHVYFHREELEELRRFGATNDLPVRMIVRAIVRDFLITKRREQVVILQQEPQQVWTVPGVSG